MRFSANQYLTTGFLTARESFSLYLYLKNAGFNQIEFVDQDGLAYFCLLAKRQGTGFINTSIYAKYLCDDQIFTKSENDLVRDYFVEQCESLLSSNFEKKDFLPLPKISVCVVTCDRPDYLLSALESLDNQTYKNFEVVIADNSATKLDLDKLASRFSFPLRIVEPKIQTPGSARNLAAASSTGEYLLFMDDDNIAAPHELEIFSKVAGQSDIDVFTCATQTFREISELENPWSLHYWFPIGSVIPLGIRHNVFGDTNFLVRKSVFEKVGGFREENFYGEDWEFLARLVLMGFSLQVIPEPLFFYREHPTNLTKRLLGLSNQNLRLTPFLKYLPRGEAKLVQALCSDVTVQKFELPISSKPALKSRVSFSGSEISDLVRETHNVVVSVISQRLNLKVTKENDPWVEIYVPAELDGPVEISFWLNSEVVQSLQIFWRSQSNPEFIELNSIKQKIPNGLRLVSFHIPDPRRTGSIRLDFEDLLGVIEIHNLVLKNFQSKETSFAHEIENRFEEFKSVAPSLGPGLFYFGERVPLAKIELKDVEVLDRIDCLNIISSSNDPQMVLPELRATELKKAFLFFKVRSQEPFQFRVFWTTKNNRDFSEEKVASINVEKGLQSGHLFVESDESIERFRIDPLESIGRFDLESFMIESL